MRNYNDVGGFPGNLLAAVFMVLLVVAILLALVAFGPGAA